MKEFDFDFENPEGNEEKYLSIKERIVDTLKWKTFTVKKIHLETEDDTNIYKKIIIEW